jgi:hypothetical protein
MADSSEVEAALVAKLSGDGALTALAADGVYMDEAPSGKTKFVIVSLVDETDESQFGGRAFEDATYRVTYRERSTSGVNAKAAAARIDALLDNQPLTVTGYTLMAMRREKRLRFTEVDEIDPSLRWQHRGGEYAVVVSL